MIDNILSRFQAWKSEHSVFTLGFSEILNLTFNLNTQQDKGDSKQGTAGSCTPYPMIVLLPAPGLL